jgi:hypothetical protein
LPVFYIFFPPATSHLQNSFAWFLAFPNFFPVMESYDEGSGFMDEGWKMKIY